MYKVDYYTLGICRDGSVGNIKQFSNTWYTEQKLENNLEYELKRVLNIMYGDEKYHPVITNIELIKGHGNR